MTDPFEEAIRDLTKAVNGQFPRPWMTDLADPRGATVFIVGKNQRNGYGVDHVGSHRRHLDALFNRNGETCRGLYREITANKASPSRRNMEGLTERLQRCGVTEVLETNVVCYSTPVSADLSRATEAGGRERGERIFRFLLEQVRPPVLVAHGADTARRLARNLGSALPSPPERSGPPVAVRLAARFPTAVIVIPSLAPPAFNRWSSWSPAHLDLVATLVADLLTRR